MERIPLNKQQLESISKLFTDNKDVLIEAHRKMVNSEYSTANRDVSMMVADMDHVIDHPSMIPVLRYTEDYPVTLKTRDIEGFSSITRAISNLCTTIVNDSRVIRSSIHIFEADATAMSFCDHTDPVDVIMLVLEGTKDILTTVDGVVTKIILNAGEYLHVPLGLVHRIENTHASIMLSIGLERYAIHHIEEEDRHGA